jgi:DNA repair protein RecN (Recombination protein N)
MLTHLQLRDLVLVDQAELELNGGLTALTGETGAGKSIVVDALLLIAGGRAGADVVRQGAERAEVTASFAALPAAAIDWLNAQSIEFTASRNSSTWSAAAHNGKCSTDGWATLP